MLYVGIDLGTTNSTVSVINIERRSDSPIDKLKSCPIYQYVRDLDNYDMDSITLPSSIYFDLDRDQVYTGKYAKKMYASGDRPTQTVRSVKTRIGGESVIEIPKISNKYDCEFFDITQCSALLLKTIRTSIQKQFPHESIDEAVVTVPAAFNNDERQATINAILLAGFKKYHILDEPTAALLYYINGGDSDIVDEDFKETEYKLVYDIGGGTLDVCIAKLEENDDGYICIDIVARSPRMNLGGDDFDQYLAGYFLSEFEKTRNSIEDYSIEDQNRIISRLVSKAEEFKISMNNDIKDMKDSPRRLERLKQYPEFELIEKMFVNGITLTKNIFDEIFLPLTNPETGQILKPIKDSLKEANLTKDDISEVILTGGMSNLYLVEESIHSFFGNETRIVPVDTETSVSKGAAMHHYNIYNDNRHIKKLELKDRMSDDIYIKIGNKFSKFIPREMDTQCGTFIYSTPETDMVDLPLFLYYGINEDYQHYVPLAGKFIKLDNLYPKGEQIDLNWEIDQNKTIKIQSNKLGIEFKFDSNRSYTEEYIRQDIINTLRVNRGV